MEQEVNIFYEDEALLLCFKPRGVLSAKDASGKCSMADLLAPREIYPVHRLDKDAIGLMVFAKTKEVAAFLSAQMGESFQKEYLARCEGFPPQEGELLVDGLRRVALKRIHVVLNSADGDVLDGFISEESALLLEPASLGDVGASSQVPLIALIEHMSIGGEGMQLFCVLFRFTWFRRLKILRWK